MHRQTGITQFRQAIVLGVLLLVALGVASLEVLPISLFPHSTKPVIRMTVDYDFDAREFKFKLGERVENSLINIENVDRVESHYGISSARFFIHFDWEKDPKEAVTEVTTVASLYQNELPDHLPPIQVAYLDAGVENYVVAKSERYSAKELGERLNDELGPALSQMDDVLDYIIATPGAEEVSVEVDPLALAQYGLSLRDVVAMLANTQFDVNLGNLRNDESGGDNHVYLVNRVSNLHELREVLIAQRGNRLVRLRDIADVRRRVADRDRAYYIDDEEAVAIAVWPQPEANLYRFSRDFRALVDTHVRSTADVVTLNDPVAYINESLSKVLLAVALGMLFSALAVWVAFRTLRLTLLIAIVIPISLLASVSVLRALGASLNIVSLSAISVAIGLVVDNAVVMMDIIATRMRQCPPADVNGLRRLINGCVAEAAPPIVTASLTTIVVFLPLVFTLPIVFSLVGELATVVVCILLFSIVCSLLLIPALIILLCGRTGRWQWLVDTKASGRRSYRGLYEQLVRGLLRARWAKTLLLGGTALCFATVTWLAIEKLPREVVAEPQPNIVDVAVSFNSADNSQRQREVLVAPIRQSIAAQFGHLIEHVFTDMRETVAYVSLHLKDYRSAGTLMAGLRQTLAATADYQIDVSPWVSAKLSVPSIPDYRIFALGSSEETRREAHAVLGETLHAAEAVYRLQSFPRMGNHRQLNIDVNASALNAMAAGRDFAATRAEIVDYVRYATEDRLLHEVRFRNADPIDLKLGLDAQNATTAVGLGNLPVTVNGQILNLRHLLHIETSQTWTHYYSRNGEEAFMTEVWLDKRRGNAAMTAMNAQLEQLRREQGSQYLVLDTDTEINDNIRSLVYALAAASVLVVITLLILNKSPTYTAIILAAIPLGFIGAGTALYVFNSTASVNSLVGLLLLTGLTINNGILITDKHRRLSGNNDIEAIVSACSGRIRAMSVTTFTSVFGLLPLAIGLGSNGAIMQPLGISMVAGLLISLLFSVLVTPVLLQMALPLLRREQAGNAPAASLSG